MKKNDFFNKKQQKNLCKNIEYVSKVFEHLMTSKNNALEFALLLSNLFLILNKF